MQNKPRQQINAKEKVLNILKRIKLSHNKVDISCDDFGISQDEYFSIILPILFKSNEKKTDSDISLIFGYFLYLNDFISAITKLSKDKPMEILHTVAEYVTCEKWESDRIIIQQGKKGNKYYIILSGSCEVVITKSQLETIRMKTYLRYLALLIEYEDFELLNRVLKENFDTLPIEISDCGTYGKVNRGVKKEEKKAKIMSSAILKQYLINEDISLIQAYSSKHNVDYALLAISVDQYISRLYNIKQKTEGESLIQTDIDDMNCYELIIYYYDKIKILQTGYQFGNIALSDSKAIRTATIITTSPTYFGILNKKTYVLSLKKTTERIRKKLLSFILSIPVFEGYSARLFTKYYESSFVDNKIHKDEFIMVQKQISDHLILIKEGLYKATLQISIQGMGEMIKFYYSKIKGVTISNTNDIHKQLNDDYSKMIETEGRIGKIIKDIGSLKRFYFRTKEIKLWNLTAPYSFGFEQFNYINDENPMSIKCYSAYGEYLTLSKVTYRNLSQSNKQVKMNENKYCNIRIVKLVKRLLSIRESQLRVFCHNSDLYLDIYSDTTPIDMLVTPKRKNCLPGQTNQVNEAKLKRFFSAETNQKKKKTSEGIYTHHQLSLGINNLSTNKTIRSNSSNPQHDLMPIKIKNNTYSSVSKSKSVQATSFLKQSLETTNYNVKNHNRNSNNNNYQLKLRNFKKRNICSSSQMRTNTRIDRTIHYKLSDISNKTLIREKDLPIELMKIKLTFLKKLNFIHHKDKTKIKSWAPYSTSIENYKQTKERNYIKEKNHYLIKTTRDIFFRRKDTMQLTRVKSCKDIHSPTLIII